MSAEGRKKTGERDATSRRLTLLGPPEFRSGEGRREIPSMPAAILRVLAWNHPEVSSRNQICKLLWPSAEKKIARHRLSQRLYWMKSRIPSLPIKRVGQSHLTLEEHNLDSDIWIIRRALAFGDPLTAITYWRAHDQVVNGTESFPEEFKKWWHQNTSRLNKLIKESLAGTAEGLSEGSHRSACLEASDMLNGVLLKTPKSRSGPTEAVEKEVGSEINASALPASRPEVGKGPPSRIAKPFLSNSHLGRHEFAKHLKDFLCQSVRTSSLAILTGPAGSGKTTFAQQLFPSTFQFDAVKTAYVLSGWFEKCENNKMIMPGESPKILIIDEAEKVGRTALRQLSDLSEDPSKCASIILISKSENGRLPARVEILSDQWGGRLGLFPLPALSKEQLTYFIFRKVGFWIEGCLIDHVQKYLKGSLRLPVEVQLEKVQDKYEFMEVLLKHARGRLEPMGRHLQDILVSLEEPQSVEALSARLDVSSSVLIGALMGLLDDGQVDVNEEGLLEIPSEVRSWLKRAMPAGKKRLLSVVCNSETFRANPSEGNQRRKQVMKEVQGHPTMEGVCRTIARGDQSYESIGRHLRQRVQLCLKLGDINEAVNTLGLLLRIALEHCDFGSVRGCLFRVSKLLDRDLPTGNVKGRLHLLRASYGLLGHDDIADEAIDIGLLLARRAGDLSLAASAHNWRLINLYNLGRLDTSEGFSLRIRAESAAQACGMVAAVALNSASWQLFRKEPESAVAVLSEMAGRRQSHDDPFFERKRQLNMCEAYIQMHEYEKAEREVVASSRRVDSSWPTKGDIASAMTLAFIKARKGERDVARRHWNALDRIVKRHRSYGAEWYYLRTALELTEPSRRKVLWGVELERALERAEKASFPEWIRLLELQQRYMSEVLSDSDRRRMLHASAELFERGIDKLGWRMTKNAG